MISEFNSLLISSTELMLLKNLSEWTMTESNDIYVQILPVIESESSNRILLCKWNNGDFKDRFTGLIRAADFKVRLYYKLAAKYNFSRYI